MAFVLNDRVKQTSTTTGTGTFSLTGTEVGFETFVTGIGDTNSTFYAIAYPAKRAPSAGMTASTYVNTHSATISDTQTMESGVLAGPVTVSGNVTVTGTLVII
jgi:hypothetical protein